MLLKQWPSIVWALFVLLLTGLPGDVFPKIDNFWDWLEPDKLVHLFIFGILSFLILYGHREQYFQRKNRYLLISSAVLISALYGFITEVLQRFVFIGRSGNVYDFLADTVGSFIGWMVFYFIFRKKIRDAVPNDQ